ncbi:hypothetical protein [Mycobacterium mantenii]|nr:hypothetical protein [Mycobacterium mantenii]
MIEPISRANEADFAEQARPLDHDGQCDAAPDRLGNNWGYRRD